MGERLNEKCSNEKSSYNIFLSSILIGCDPNPVHYKNNVLEKFTESFHSTYYGEQEDEEMYCLYGEKEETITVDSISRAYEKHADNKSFRGFCNETKSYLGTAHQHPSGSCTASDKDLANLILNNDDISSIICYAKKGEDARLKMNTLVKKDNTIQQYIEFKRVE